MSRSARAAIRQGRLPTPKGGPRAWVICRADLDRFKAARPRRGRLRRGGPAPTGQDGVGRRADSAPQAVVRTPGPPPEPDA